jgi:hypothetical protein
VAYVDFDDPTWNAASFSTQGALVYNASKGNKSIGVLNFGAIQTMVNQGFQILMPSNSSDAALIRIN